MKQFLNQLNSPGGHLAMLVALIFIGIIASRSGMAYGEHIAITALVVLLHRLSK